MKKTNTLILKSKKDVIFVQGLVQSIAESLLIQGYIKTEDFSDKKILLEKIRKLIPENEENLFLTITYHVTLLTEGKRYVKTKNYELAYIFYATYFEHFINEILDIWAKKNSIEYRISSSLIRRVTLEDKYTWVLKLLKLPVFNEKHWKTIKIVSEKRNNFIHYKYNSESANTSFNPKEEEWEKDYINILSAVTYTKRYRTKIVFNGKKEKFKI